MRVLLTGGAGFIGSHIALLLLQKGYDVVILDSFVNSSSKVTKAISNYLLTKSFNFNLNTLQLKNKTNDIYLTEGENKLLLKLIKNKNKIVLREELTESNFDESELRKVDVQITRLRHKIEENPKQPLFIKTIRGKGYKLICNEL